MQKIYTQKEIERWESTNDPIMNSLWYRNKPGIRASGVNIKITNDEMALLYRYHRDPVSFIHQYGLVYPGGNRCKPVLTPEQERILMDHDIKRHYPVSLPRQTGLTSSIKFMALCDIIFGGRDVVLITPRMDKSAGMIRDIMEMYAGLPFYMKPGVNKMEEVCVRFENGGRLTAWPAGRPMGRNVDVLFIDDFQYLDRNNRESIFRTWLPVMTSVTSTKIFIGTTGEIPEELRGIGEFAIFMDGKLDWIRVK